MEWGRSFALDPVVIISFKIVLAQLIPPPVPAERPDVSRLWTSHSGCDPAMMGGLSGGGVCVCVCA